MSKKQKGKCDGFCGGDCGWPCSRCGAEFGGRCAVPDCDGERRCACGEDPVKKDSAGYTTGPTSDGGMDPREPRGPFTKPLPAPPRPDRRVRSVSTSLCATREGYLVRTVVVACEDGTIWRMCDNEAGKPRWNQLPAIPGAEEE